ncbi:MAG: hypothetical protein KZQ73_00420 [Candidatus Thiodiazotropha sp. (ex Semelilucina semeliformis)]|nr:hypothetical protein [Candidatus Thiodiazotropha sp. (ex Semelilucina semeliformis)]
MNTAGLSLDQAPPIIIPVKFFLTASLFSVFIGALILIEGEEIFLSRWSPLALGLTHLVTVGFLAQVMTGAMMQLLPVLAGSPVPAVIATSRAIHLSMLTGAVLLVIGFIQTYHQSLIIGASFLAVAFLIILVSATISLFLSKSPLQNTMSVSLGWIALVPTAVFGLFLVLGLTGVIQISDMTQMTTLHLSWGLLGWVGIVLFSTIFKIIPIFYVTKAIPSSIQVWSLPVVFFLLILTTVSNYLNAGLLKTGLLFTVVLFLVIAFFAAASIHRRKRKIIDSTLLFVWTGIFSLVLSAVAWILSDNDILVGTLLLWGVCLTVPIGVIYKIIPFLCWFHLQGMQIKREKLTYTLPSMKYFIRERSAKAHYYMHMSSFCLLLIAFMLPAPFTRLAGLAFTLSSLYLFKNILFAFLRFRREQRLLCSEG